MGFGWKRKPRRQTLPAFETLEGRAVPATFHVANVVELENDINALAGSQAPETIIMRPGNYSLTAELNIQNMADLTIEPPAKDTSPINILAAYPNRVMEINGSNVKLVGLTLFGGSTVAHGGGIDVENSNVSLRASTVSDNSATGAGAGIYVENGTLTTHNTAISGNTVGGTESAQGGGIAAVNSTLNLTGTTINNDAVFALIKNSPQTVPVATGGGIAAQGGTLTMWGVKITNNVASASTSSTNAVAIGGGVSTVNTPVTLTTGLVQNNSVNTIASQVNFVTGSAFSTNGGTLTITNSTFTENAPAGPYLFYHPNGLVIVRASKLDGKNFSGSYTLQANGFVPNR